MTKLDITPVTNSLEELINALNVASLSNSESKVPEKIDPFSNALNLSPKTENEDHPTDKVDAFIRELRNVKFPGEAIQYSAITRFVFDEGIGSFEGLVLIIDEIRELVEEYHGEELEQNVLLSRYFYKLIDHLMLAAYQIEEMRNRARSEFEITERALDRNNYTINSIEEKITSLKDQTDSLLDKVYSNFITVLGIFTAIVFSMFGGLKLLEFSISALNTIATWKATIFFSMFAVATLSMLFILMRWISIIVDSMTKRKRDYKVVSILSSHFGFTVAIIFFMYLMFISVLFSNKIVLTNFQEWVAGYSNYLIVGFILLLPALIFLLFLIIYLFKNKSIVIKL
ncbi:hypothetical protein [Sporosarcina sp. USHLN248]|uniref:hypothetical protein n=1 Tax=Sporosarcina sp. USHLN248 TaxID=3081300 RepID=UPI0030168AB8